MEITVNGEKRAAPDGITVNKLLETLNIVPERVVVELNLKILKRAEHVNATLESGDQIEIVRFVGGGSSHLPELKTIGVFLPGASNLEPIDG